jgi:hypothetical protein
MLKELNFLKNCLDFWGRIFIGNKKEFSNRLTVKKSLR